MGDGGFKKLDWTSYSASRHVDTARKVDDILRTGSYSVKNEWLPYNVIRESCDSDEHPNSTPIIIGLDATGSMDGIVKDVAKGIGDTMTEIIERECVPHPQILFSVIDDYVTSEEKCIQVTQFESDIRIAKQMHDLNFIGRGGGNSWESFADLWYFAAYRTRCDAIKKKRKGILITVGDDGIQPSLSASEIKSVFGVTIEDSSISTPELYSRLSRDWEVFHISCSEGSTYSYHTYRVKSCWDKLLGEHHIILDDATKICEVIVSLLQTIKGDSVEEIASSWDNSTALVVSKALGGLSVRNNSSSDVVVF